MNGQVWAICPLLPLVEAVSAFAPADGDGTTWAAVWGFGFWFRMIRWDMVYLALCLGLLGLDVAMRPAPFEGAAGNGHALAVFAAKVFLADFVERRPFATGFDFVPGGADGLHGGLIGAGVGVGDADFDFFGWCSGLHRCYLW